MLATDDPRRYGLRDTRLCRDRPARAFDDHPVSIFYSIGRGCIGMNISGGLRRCLTQAGETAQLAMDISGKLRVGQHQRVFVGHVAPAEWADQRFHILGQRRKPVRGKRMGVDLHFLIGRVKPAGNAVLVRCGEFSVARRSGNADSSGRPFELRKGYAGRRQLMLVAGFGIAFPELTAKTTRFANSKIIQVSERRSARGGTTAGRYCK